MSSIEQQTPMPSEEHRTTLGWERAYKFMGVDGGPKEYVGHF
jgi:hypothetical protein